MKQLKINALSFHILFPLCKYFYLCDFILVVAYVSVDNTSVFMSCFSFAVSIQHADNLEKPLLQFC